MSSAAKHGWSFTHQFLTGITFKDWLAILRENKLAVDARYWHRAAFLTGMSIVNSLYQLEEKRDYDAAVATTQVVEPPVFILGHWRSGTTHLHNLLTLDPQFTFPTVYEASFPNTFLTTESTIPRWVNRYVPQTRLFDNVAFQLNLPQEDEFAICVASGYSSLLGMVFPRRTEHYDRYLTFRDVPRDEVEQWKQTLLWFLKKLTYKHPGQPIVLKSPPHTARVRLLLELFPDARFVHIYRNPYAVFQSTRHMYDTMAWHTYLQRPAEEAINEGILRRYTDMYDAYFEDREHIPAGRLFEVRFEDLRRDPLEHMRALYAQLNLPGFDAFEPKLQQYIESLSTYQQNDYSRLSDSERAVVSHAWERNFERWGYAV